MKSEADVKRAMVKAMVAGGGYARRIEDQYGVGIFDVILIPYNLPVFMAEAKLIRGNTFGPTERQYVELVRIENVGAIDKHVIPVMIGWRDDSYYFHKPAKTIDYRDCFSVTTTKLNFYDQLIKYYHAQKG